ncbi:MAG: hypothetical protein ACRDWI_06935 [Jiangellaceae bacterium]
MRSTYRVLAYLVAAGVALQASSVALGFFTIIHEVDDGGVFSAGYDYEGNLGLMVHRVGGLGLIPLCALALLIVSLFTKAPVQCGGRSVCSAWWSCRSRWCSPRPSPLRLVRCMV